MDDLLQQANFDRISKIIVNGKSLIIVFAKNKLYQGFYNSGFMSDEEVRKVIKEKTDWAYNAAIQKIDDDNYLLNIVPVENFGACPVTFNFGEKGFTHDILIRQLDIYMPIIRKFMLDN